jgi:hypothetical protein
MATAPHPLPVPRKSRRRLFIVVGFLLLLAATPVGYYLVNDWLYHREVEALCRELDAEDLAKAGLLKEAFKDPFDGQPLRWKQTPTGIVIYSLAPTSGAGFELWRPELRGMSAPGER